MNTFGRNFRCTTFGESHGRAVGVVIDGCPPGMPLTEGDIQPYLDRRRPGKSPLESGRREPDRVEILSGTFEGRTTGAPIALIVPNQDVRSEDYDALRDVYRPGHADYTWQASTGCATTVAGAGVPAGRRLGGSLPVRWRSAGLRRAASRSVVRSSRCTG